MFVSRDPVEQAKTTSWVLTALQAGDRHIDKYGNSTEQRNLLKRLLGFPAVKNSSLPRNFRKSVSSDALRPVWTILASNTPNVCNGPLIKV